MDLLFKSLGLSPKETQTFLKLLELGAQPVSVVAKHVGVPRTTMYFILDRLKGSQLVEEFERGGIKYAKCIPVQNIGNILKRREKQVRHTLELFEQYLPHLQSMESSFSINPNVRFVEGKEAIVALYESLAADTDCSAILNPAAITLHIPECLGLLPALARKGQGNVRQLVIDSPEARAYKKVFSTKKHPIRLLPPYLALDSDTVICKNRVCMFSYGDRYLTAFEILSPVVAQTQLAMFEQLWEAKMKDERKK